MTTKQGKATYETHPYTGELVPTQHTTATCTWQHFAETYPAAARRVVRCLHGYEEPVEVHRQQDFVAVDRLIAVAVAGRRQEYVLIGDTKGFPDLF